MKLIEDQILISECASRGFVMDKFRFNIHRVGSKDCYCGKVEESIDLNPLDDDLLSKLEIMAESKSSLAAYSGIKEKSENVNDSDSELSEQKSLIENQLNKT